MKFPSLHFGADWAKLLYGDKGEAGAVKLPPGQLCSLSPPSLGFGCSLSLGGEVEYSAAGKWKLNLSPVNFPLEDAELFKGDQFASMRSASGEIGISFDKQGAKHFFTFGQSPSVPKFSLKLKVSILE